MTISSWFLLRMRNVLNKSCTENDNTRFTFGEFFSENRAVYEKMSKNMVEPERTPTIWRLHVAYWISKPTRPRSCTHMHLPPPHTHTHTDMQKYIILIAFHGNRDFTKASQCYVTRTLPVSFPLLKCPDRLCVPSNLQFKGYRISLPEVMQQGYEPSHSLPCNAEEWVQLHLYSPILLHGLHTDHF
jgi:hypothetical protein